MVSLESDSLLCRHKIIEEVGRGAMAVVFRAHDPFLNRDVAIKVLPPFLAEEPGYVDRFKREAQAAARLNHPNILRVHDFGTDKGFTYIVTEYLPGGTLRGVLHRAPLSLEEALQLVRPLGAALDYAHLQGVIHRDVKPANVLLDAESVPVLGDFGIARIMEEAGRATQTDSVLGTPDYMAPEQGLGGVVDHRAVLYAFGVVLHEMLVGRPPFRADTPAATMLAHIHQPPSPASTLNPDIDAATDDILLKALAKTPSERYQSAREMVESLTALRRGSREATVHDGSKATLVSPNKGGSSMSHTRLMIVDDHEVVRTGLRAILEPEKDLEVIGEAGSADEAVAKVSRLSPNVILMDVRMGETSGIEACRLVKSAHPDIGVLMYTSFGEQDAVMSAIMAGASGYLLKNVGRADLLKAIRAVADGQSLLDPAVTRDVMTRLAELAASEESKALEAVSEREREVLALVAQGLTSKEIADRLVISENTARNHVSRILDKLGLTRRSEAAAFAAQHGLLDSRDETRETD